MTVDTVECRWVLLKILYELLETTGTSWHSWNRWKPLNPHNPDWFHWKGNMNAWKSPEAADTTENRKRKTAENNRIRWGPIECRLVENAIWIIGNHLKQLAPLKTTENAEHCWIHLIPMDFIEKAERILGNRRTQATPLKNLLKTAESAEFRWASMKKLYASLGITGNRWLRW